MILTLENTARYRNLNIAVAAARSSKARKSRTNRRVCDVLRGSPRCFCCGCVRQKVALSDRCCAATECPLSGVSSSGHCAGQFTTFTFDEQVILDLWMPSRTHGRKGVLGARTGSGSFCVKHFTVHLPATSMKSRPS